MNFEVRRTIPIRIKIQRDTQRRRLRYASDSTLRHSPLAIQTFQQPNCCTNAKLLHCFFLVLTRQGYAITLILGVKSKLAGYS